MFGEARGFIVRRNWLPLAVSVALLTIGVVLARNINSGFAPLGYLAGWFGLVLGPIFVARNAFPLSKPTTIRATATGIAIEGYGDLSLEDILETKVVPRGESALVELALRNGKRLVLKIAAVDAYALATFLGARRTRFRLVVSYVRRLFVVFGIFAMLAFFVARGLELWLFMWPACFLYASVFAWLIGYLRGTLVIGADGFTTSWLFRERFVAFRDVDTVRGTTRLLGGGVDDTVVVLAASKRTLRLRTVEAPNTEAERGTESRAMLRHMGAAFEQSRRLSDASVDIPALVERGSRSAREWLAGLDALVRGGGARYRVAAVSPEMLGEVVSDPSASIESRVGAAAALVRIGDDAFRTRVRVVAEGCAESELRETLLALAGAHDDESTEAALRRCRSLPSRS